MSYLVIEIFRSSHTTPGYQEEDSENRNVVVNVLQWGIKVPTSVCAACSGRQFQLQLALYTGTLTKSFNCSSDGRIKIGGTYEIFQSGDPHGFP